MSNEFDDEPGIAEARLINEPVDAEVHDMDCEQVYYVLATRFNSGLWMLGLLHYTKHDAAAERIRQPGNTAEYKIIKLKLPL